MALRGKKGWSLDRGSPVGSPEKEFAFVMLAGGRIGYPALKP